MLNRSVKFLSKCLYIVAGLAIVALVVLFLYLSSQKPQYNGSVQMIGLNNQVEVLFDTYGIPHIYAENEEDAYTALGYVHAQERLFQMEMIRRVASGRLSEIFGKEFIAVDKFFKTLCFEEHALESIDAYVSDTSQPYQKAAIAYVKGINRFIETGRTPVEFSLLGIAKEKFSLTDLYLTTSYMAFNFAQGFKTDPVLSFISKKYGSDYLADVGKSNAVGTIRIPVYINDTTNADDTTALASTSGMLSNLPSPPLIGSNGWVMSGAKTKSGKPLLANDTHIGYSQPCVWYEAHMVYPGFNFYGNYLAGFPFAAIGHNEHAGWGLTMFMNDDIDFYTMRIKPGDKFKVMEKGKWKPLKTIRKVVKVKDDMDREVIVRVSKHGPLVQGVMPEWKYITTDAVALSWTHLKFPSNLLQVTYDLNHAQNINESRAAVSQIISPGLNVMYGDNAGNIAWWAAGKLIHRPKHVNSSLLLNGVSDKDEPLGYYDFSYNPKSENPPNGYVYSANNQPDSVNGLFVPGYYVSDDRAKRLTRLLSEKEKYGVDDFQRINYDVISDAAPKIAQEILGSLSGSTINKSALHNKSYTELVRWNGDHEMRNVEPTIYYRLVYYILEFAMKDEIGDANFKTYLQTHAMKSSLSTLIENEKSKWWDNVQTKSWKETRSDIFNRAFDQTVTDLSKMYGDKVSGWMWGRAHRLEHVHPVGMQKPFNYLFNVGPYPVPGGNETINNSGFDLTNERVFKVKFGPAMRLIVDFANVENSKSVLPTGQSGNFMSNYYNDQAPIYNYGKLRKQKMNREEIVNTKAGRLVFIPAR